MNRPTRAFILGAGLGTRLRPLTEHLPKPLVPLNGRPLVCYAMDHLASIGVREVIINTHHAAGRWIEHFPSRRYHEINIEFRHEPILLDTGGGLKNVEDFFIRPSTFIVYNGDILTNLDLDRAIAHHERKRNLVTMVLRSDVEPRHVALDRDSLVCDIRGMLGTGEPGRYLFSGIHIIETDLFRHIPNKNPQSIINIYLDLIRKKERIGGVALNEGEWSDIGTISEYERISGLPANWSNKSDS